MEDDLGPVNESIDALDMFMDKAKARQVTSKGGWGRKRETQTTMLKKRLEPLLDEIRNTIAQMEDNDALRQQVEAIMLMVECAPTYKDIRHCFVDLGKLRGLYIERRQLQMEVRKTSNLTKDELVRKLVDGGWVSGAKVINGKVVRIEGPKEIDSKVS